MSYKKTIMLVGGSKGGVGKSLCAGSVTDCLWEQDPTATLLIDADPANADARLWCGPGLVDRVPLKTEWNLLVDRCASAAETVVVVNLPAGEIASWQRAEELVRYAAATLGWRVIYLYLLSPTPGSIRILPEMVHILHPWGKIMVLRNLFFSEQAWEIWNFLAVKGQHTPVREMMREAKVSESDFPVLPVGAFLAAHQPGWVSLRDSAARQVPIAATFYLKKYRQNIATLLQTITNL